MADSMFIMPFGNYRGQPIENINKGYLEWVSSQDWFIDKYEEGADAIGRELAYRERFTIDESDFI